jgi:hypothetical protein
MKERTPNMGFGGLSGRRVLDTAEGILVGLRRYHTDAAFSELLDVSRRHAVPVFALASALIELASGRKRPADTALPAWSSAQREWGGLLSESRSG